MRRIRTLASWSVAAVTVAGVIVATTPDAAAALGPTFGSAVLAAAGASRTWAVPCGGPGGGESGLDAAITAADASAGTSTIVLAQGCSYVLTHELDVPDSSGLPAISASITIQAPALSPSTTITRSSSAPAFSIASVDAGGDLTLSRLTVSGGLVGDGLVGAGLSVAARGTLRLVQARVTDNTALGTHVEQASGGGIYTLGTLTLDRSRVDHNHVVNRTPGQLAIGGGITNEGAVAGVATSMTLRDSLIDDNTVSSPNGDQPAAVGAGIATLGTAATVLDDTDVVDNHAVAGGAGGAALGGGLFDNLSFFTGVAATSLTVTGGRVDGNSVSVGGSGFGFAAGAAEYAAQGDVTDLQGSTVIERNAAGAAGPGAAAQGGAIYVEPAASVRLAPGTVVAANAATSVGTGSVAFGGAVANSGATSLDGVLLTTNRAVASGVGSLARGAGVWTSAGTAAADGLILNDSDVVSNHALARHGGAADGGGVYVDAGPVVVSGGTTIRRNTPDDQAP